MSVKSPIQLEPTEDEFVHETFTFEFPTCTTSQLYKLKVPMKIPLDGSIKELGYRIMSSFKLPCHIEPDLMTALETFVNQKTLKFYDDKADSCVERAKNGELDVEDIIRRWERWYKQTTVEYAEPIGTTDEELFAAAYHRLVHSPSLEPILQAEHSFGWDVTKVVERRDEEFEQLTKRFNIYTTTTLIILNTK